MRIERVCSSPQNDIGVLVFPPPPPPPPRSTTYICLSIYYMYIYYLYVYLYMYFRKKEQSCTIFTISACVYNKSQIGRVAKSKKRKEKFRKICERKPLAPTEKSYFLLLHILNFIQSFDVVVNLFFSPYFTNKSDQICT